jgi:glycosyltransferase involved in cell wall biosynthesis
VGEPPGGLRVAFDITARTAGMTGVARYAEQLEPALGRLGVDVRRYALGRASQPVPPGTRHVPIPLRVLYGAWATVRLPRVEWLAPSADIVHTLDLAAPPSHRPSVLTVHDLAALERPELHSARAVATQRSVLRSVGNASVVLTNSRATADVLERHGADPDRLTVTPLGLTPLPPTPPATLPDAARYVLCVGALARRKGQSDLLQAWARLAAEPDTILVLAGPDGHGADEIRALAARLDIAARVRFVGKVNDERLAGLYQGAAVVCVPSRAEGFGLSVLEGMAAGVPVVASDLEAIREVAADTVALVAPGSPAALADVLRSVLDEGVPVARLAAARERAARYTWDACAAATLDAYRRALDG